MKRYKIKKKNIAQQCKTCKHLGEGCWFATDNEKCIKRLPVENTNITELNMAIETPPEITSDILSQMFTNWCDTNGWFYGGIIKLYTEDDDI